MNEISPEEIDIFVATIISNVFHLSDLIKHYRRQQPLSELRRKRDKAIGKYSRGRLTDEEIDIFVATIISNVFHLYDDKNA